MIEACADDEQVISDFRNMNPLEACNLPNPRYRPLREFRVFFFDVPLRIRVKRKEALDACVYDQGGEQHQVRPHEAGQIDADSSAVKVGLSMIDVIPPELSFV